MADSAPTIWRPYFAVLHFSSDEFSENNFSLSEQYRAQGLMPHGIYNKHHHNKGVHMNYKEIHDDSTVVLKRYASIKANIKKHNSNFVERELWDSVPVIDEDSQYGDLVKDFSVDSRHGHVGIVSNREPFTKRDGRFGVRIEFKFINHTTVNQSPDVRTRKLEFIYKQEAPVATATVREFNFVVVATVDEHGVTTFSIDSNRSDACVEAVYEYPAGTNQYDDRCELRGYNDRAEVETASRLFDLIADALVSISYPTNA